MGWNVRDLIDHIWLFMTLRGSPEDGGAKYYEDVGMDEGQALRQDSASN